LSPAPHEIGRHVVLDGTGDVLRAYDRERRHEVTLVLCEAPVADAQALAKLAHPNLAEVYEVGLHEGRGFVATEAIDGPTLAQWSIRPRGWREVLAIVVAGGDGLAAAHAAGVVHGAFSSANVILEKARLVRVTGFGTNAGTKLDDLEAFAAVAWEAIYGKPPFADPGSTARELSRVDERRAPSWLHAALARVLTAAPSDRRDMPALLAELRRDVDRAKYLRIAGVAVAIGATVAGVAGIRSWIEHERIVACEEEGALIGTLWNDDARSDLETSIAHSGATDPQSIAARTTVALDEFATRWHKTRAQVCIGREIDLVVGPEAYAGTLSCLETRHLALEALLAELARLDDNTAYRAIDAAAALPSPTDCSSPAHHGALHPAGLPIEPVRAVRTSLARASVLLAIGKVPEARELAATALDEAITLDWRPLVADARLQLCAVERTAQHPEPAHAACEAAYFDAARDQRLDVMADAAILLVEITGTDPARDDEARQWAMHAAAALVQSLAIAQRDLGPTHPQVTATRTRLETLDAPE